MIHCAHIAAYYKHRLFHPYFSRAEYRRTSEMAYMYTLGACDAEFAAKWPRAE